MNDENFDFEKSNEDINDVLNTDEKFWQMDQNLKPMLKRLSLSLIIYMISSQLIAAKLQSFLDLGSLMLISVSISLLILVVLQRKKSLKSIFPYKEQSFDLRDFLLFLGLMMGSSIVFAKLVEIFMQVFNIYSENIMDLVATNINPLMFLYVVILGPLIEEIIYRGYLLQSLRTYSKQAALIISTLAFAFMHGNIEQSLSVLGLSFFLNYVGIFYSWKAAFLLHFVNNLQAILIYNLSATFGANHPLLSIYSVLIILLISYSIFQLFKGRYEKFWKNIRSDEMDLRYRNKIIYSLPIFILIIFYLVNMVLTQFS